MVGPRRWPDPSISLHWEARGDEYTSGDGSPIRTQNSRRVPGGALRAMRPDPWLKFVWADICVPLWRLDQGKWNPLRPAKYDPYGVQIDLINRRRAELHRVAAGIMGCLPEPVPTKRRRASSVPLP
jgi:hypothetical protein